MIHLTPAELIAIKRDGGALSKQMIDDVVAGITDMSLSDAQVGAFAMAVRVRGMNIDDFAPRLSFFWGIGLLAHGLSTFLPYFILGKDWEERKIKELMDKERNANKWE